ncbi:MAG TPA: type II toxin-antitoxin system PemK/MazF family toxin [Thermomicrobiales bacterium]|nr:type II toxin-antitoxin system PemK/MazF family toxin [Thermomicrobiales bacterium]
MINRTEPRVGEIWNVNFDPQRGREQAGIRPGLVISHDRFNQVPNGLHIVVPITGIDRGLAYHVPIRAPEGGLTKDSQIMCEQEKSQSIERFIDRRGAVSEQTLQRVRDIVAALIDR